LACTYFADVVGGGGDFMLLAMAWMVMAAVMYLLRPSSMRGQGDAKPQGLAFFFFSNNSFVSAVRSLLVPRSEPVFF
jgi:hypothetical protein